METKTKTVLLWSAFALFAAASVTLLFMAQPVFALLCMLGAFGALIGEIVVLRRQAQDAAHEAEAARAAQQAQAAETDRLIEASRAETRAQMEEFRSLLSHQIRMPLSIVQGYADMLARDMVDDEEKKKEFLGKISEHTHLIGDALSQQLRTIEDKRDAAAVLQRVDAAELLRQAAADMEAVAADSGITIQTLFTQDEIPMDADRFQINKALFNIIENSCKYMGRPGLITLRADCDDESVTISVKDDGLGLPGEEATHIFERNYQGSNSSGGHGHGLYLVRCAAEAHGGTVEAHSAPGLGMEIRMTLPRWRKDD